MLQPLAPNRGRVSGGHYCPVCLRSVRAADAQRRAHHEQCSSGLLDVALLLCPTCGIALAAEIDPHGDLAHLPSAA